MFIYEQTQFNTGQRNSIDMQFNQQTNGLNGQTNFAANNENWGQPNNELMDVVKQMNNTVTAVSSRLSSIEAILGNLGNIESDLSAVKFDVSNIKINNLYFNKRLIDVEVFSQSNSDSFDTINKTNETHRQQLSDLKKKNNITNFNDISGVKEENQYLRNQLSEMQSCYSNLKEEILVLKTRSMQENLLFFGIPEPHQQTVDNGLSGAASLDEGAQSTSVQITEDIEQVLRKMLHRELPLESPNIVLYIKFDRVHRLGARKRNSSNPRPIVAKLERTKTVRLFAKLEWK